MAGVRTTCEATCQALDTPSDKYANDAQTVAYSKQVLPKKFSALRPLGNQQASRNLMIPTKD